ncbi:PQQ-binding-like beta-propeller repeat protein [Streptomyces sp. L7]
MANSAREGLCQATAHQVVCGTRSGGLLGRSRNTGKVTWSVPATGSVKKPVLVVDAADERAVAGGGEILRAANLRTGKAAWTHRLADGSISVAIDAADGTVYALEALAKPSEDVVLRAFQASDGRQLWHRTVDADPCGDMAAFGGRVYITDGTRVTARDARTGTAAATSPRATECPNLVSGGGYLVCTGSPYSAMDYFPPLQRLDPSLAEAPADRRGHRHVARTRSDLGRRCADAVRDQRGGPGRR